MRYWARTPQACGQQVLFATTVDDVIPPEDPVRLFAELLDGFDRSSWEAQYHGAADSSAGVGGVVAVRAAARGAVQSQAGGHGRAQRRFPVAG